MIKLEVWDLVQDKVSRRSLLITVWKEDGLFLSRADVLQSLRDWPQAFHFHSSSVLLFQNANWKISFQDKRLMMTSRAKVFFLTFPYMKTSFNSRIHCRKTFWNSFANNRFFCVDQRDWYWEPRRTMLFSFLCLINNQRRKVNQCLSSVYTLSILTKSGPNHDKELKWETDITNSKWMLLVYHVLTVDSISDVKGDVWLSNKLLSLCHCLIERPNRQSKCWTCSRGLHDLQSARHCIH